MKKTHGLILKTIFLSVIIILLSVASFAENEEEGVYYPDSETTTKIAETTTGAIDKFINDSGIGDTVNKVMDNVDKDSLNSLGDTISGALSSITDTISDALGSYSSSLSGYFTDSTTTVPATNGNSYSQFAVPSTQSGNSSASVYNNTAQQQTETTTVSQTEAPQTTVVQQTVSSTTPQTTVRQSVQPQSEHQDNIWVFIVAVAMVIFAILFVLILLTRRTQYNSRVYDKSTLKSVKRSRVDDDIIDDDGDPLDNIMFFNDK